MSIIRQYGVGNIPNLQSIKIYDIDDVVELYTPGRYSTGTISPQLPQSSLNIKSGAEAIRVWFPPGDGLFKETQLITDQGLCWDTIVTQPLPGDFIEAGMLVERLSCRKVIVVTLDNNGQTRLVGTKLQPLDFSCSYDSTSKKRILEFKGLTKKQAYYLPGFTDVDIHGLGAGFSFGFSFGFNS